MEKDLPEPERTKTIQMASVVWTNLLQFFCAKIVFFLKIIKTLLVWLSVTNKTYIKMLF